MKVKTMLMALQVMSWIIFVGLSIDAAGYLTNTVATLFFKPDLAGHFWNKLDLSAVYNLSESRFLTLTVLMSIATTLKAILFYMIILLFQNKNLNIDKPFTTQTNKTILICAYIALGIGFFSGWGMGVHSRLIDDGIKLPSLEKLSLEGNSIWIFMGVILLIVGFLFKRGIEIQEENDLTL